jgi:hypothetical protein
MMSRDILRVTLTPEECEAAIAIGRARHATHERVGRRDAKVDRRAGESIHVQGALAEQALAVALKLEWDGAFKPLDEWHVWRREGGDVQGIEVKATHRVDGCILLQAHNRSTNAFVLVLTLRHAYPTFFIVGWKFGDEIRQDVFWDTSMPRPCWRVRQPHLRSVRSLAKVFPRDRKRTKWVRECRPEQLESGSKSAV